MTDVAQAVVPPPVDVRDELRASHRLRQEAMRNHEHAMAAERRGRALMQDAERELAEIEHQEAADATIAAGRIAAGIAAGQPMPTLPERPAGWLERKATAQDRVSAARQAHHQLEAQLAASARAVAQATTAQQGAIARLLRDRGEQLAIETEAAERLALHLRDELTALGRVHLTTAGPGRPVLIKLGLRGMRVLNGMPLNDVNRQKPGGIDLLAAVAQRWRDAAVALMSDPEAPLPGGRGLGGLEAIHIGARHGPAIPGHRSGRAPQDGECGDKNNPVSPRVAITISYATAAGRWPDWDGRLLLFLPSWLGCF
jgi:hypothetical protein